MRSMPCRHISEVDVAEDFRAALRGAGDALELDVTWLYSGGFHFRLGSGWTIALTPESAGRVRVEACRWTRPVTTLWSLLDDAERLVEVVGELRDQVTQTMELEQEGVA